MSQTDIDIRKEVLEMDWDLPTFTTIYEEVLFWEENAKFYNLELSINLQVIYAHVKQFGGLYGKPYIPKNLPLTLERYINILAKMNPEDRSLSKDIFDSNFMVWDFEQFKNIFEENLLWMSAGKEIKRSNGLYISTNYGLYVRFMIAHISKYKELYNKVDSEIYTKIVTLNKTKNSKITIEQNEKLEQKKREPNGSQFFNFWLGDLST